MFALLALSTAVGQGALHIVLPALGEIARDFDVSFGVAQLTVSVSMLAMAAMTVVAGPLADIFGRRPVFLGGLILFLAGSMAATISPTIFFVVAGRIVQSAGGVIFLVLGRTILRDLYEGPVVAKAVAFLVIGQVIGSALSPVIGSLIIVAGSWRWVLGFTVAMGAVMLVFAAINLQETRSKEIEFSSSKFWKITRTLLKRPDFWAAALIGSVTMSMFFSIISSGSWAVSEKFGLNPIYYAYLMLALSAFFIVGNFLSGRFVERIGLLPLLSIGSTGIVASAAAFWIVIGADAALWVYLLPGSLFALANGFVLANSVALAIGIEPQAAGTASGIAVLCQLGLAAIVSQFAGNLLPKHGLIALAIILVICAAAVVLLLAVLLRRSVIPKIP